MLYKVGDLCKYMIPLQDGIIGIQILDTDYIDNMLQVNIKFSLALIHE